MMQSEVLRMIADESELVREAAAAEASYTTTLDKMLALRQVSVFRHLEPASLLSLARASQLELYSPGEALCVEGEPGRDILMLLSGEAEVSRASPGGQRLLNVQGAGAVIGEMAVLDPGPRSATVRVREQGAEVLRLPGSAFRDVVAADSDIATTVIQTLVRRLRRSELDPTERGGPVSVRA